MDEYIPREAEKKLDSWLKKKEILMLLGARQVGKTTLLKRYFQEKKYTYLNFDIETDKNLFLKALPLDPKSALQILGSPKVLIIDESQRLPEVNRIVKGWYDYGVNTRIILSGSSSLDILDRFTESLTGRNIKLSLPPLLFREILSSQDWYTPTNNFSKKDAFFEQIQTLMLNSIVYGSYPHIFAVPDREEYLNNLVSDYLLKDIFQLSLVKTPNLIRRLLSLLAYQVGSVVSVNELATSLGIARITVNRYLDLLERTFVIFRLPAFSSNPRKEISKSQKILFWDTGIRNALIGEISLNPLRSDIGNLWENWIIAEFAKRNLLEGNLNQLYFWRSKNGSEVDLVVKNPTGGLKAYEIKWSRGKATRAFSPKYKIPVEVVNKENFLNHIS